MSRRLSFRGDGTFTIVQFTDLHWQNGEPADLRTRDLMERMLRAEQPDLVVFTGDLIYSPKCRDPYQAIRHAVGVAERSGIPWAAVFGNHDAERGVKKEDLMAVLQEHQGCLAEPGPSDIHGIGNYTVRLDDKNGRTQAALIFLDSGGLSEVPSVPGYDWIRRSQIGWYTDESKRLQRENGGAEVPSLAFFHIPLPEYEEMWRSQTCYGRRYERVASPRVNSGFFAAMAARGDVMGTFCGHDHTNEYGGKLLNVRLYYGRASGYQAYGRWGYSRGARVIRLKAGEKDFETWVRLHNGRKIDHPPIHRPWMLWFTQWLRRLFRN